MRKNLFNSSLATAPLDRQFRVDLASYRASNPEHYETEHRTDKTVDAILEAFTLEDRVAGYIGRAAQDVIDDAEGEADEDFLAAIVGLAA